MSDQESKDALLAALLACDGSAALKRVLNSDACEDATYGEHAMYREGAEIIASKAQDWKKPADVAAAIMWLSRLSSFAPDRIIRPNTMIKEPVIDVLDQQRGFLREACGAKEAPIRVAAAHALACCRATNVDDVTLLEGRWTLEKNKAALATIVLSAGVIAKRHADELENSRCDEIAQRARALAAHADVVVRLCGVAAATLLDPVATREDIAILCEAIDAVAKLPSQWGWFWLKRKLDTRDMAAEACTWVRAEEPGELLATLIRARRAVPNHAALTDALMQLAFPRVSASGVALEELDEPQRRAVETLSEHPSDRWERQLGLGLWKAVPRFLEGQHLAWRPVDVATSSGPRRWHFHKIWAAHICGELTQVEAADAIIDAFEPQQVVDVVVEAGLPWTEAGQRLAIAVFERLQRQGLDVVAAVAEAQQKSESSNRVMPMIGILVGYQCRDELPPAALDQAIAKALADLKTAAPFDELLARLGSDRCERILLASEARLEPSWAWDGMLVAHTALTNAVARAMVERVHAVPEQFDVAVAAIARAGEAGWACLTQLDLSADLAPTRDALLAARPAP